MQIYFRKEIKMPILRLEDIQGKKKKNRFVLIVELL